MPGEIINGSKLEKGEVTQVKRKMPLTRCTHHLGSSSRLKQQRSSCRPLQPSAKPAAAPAQNCHQRIAVAACHTPRSRLCDLIDQWFQSPAWHVLEHVSENPQVVNIWNLFRLFGHLLIGAGSGAWQGAHSRGCRSRLSLQILTVDCTRVH